MGTSAAILGSPVLSSERGRLMSAAEIATEIFRGSVTPTWVKRNVAPSRKLRLGHSTVRWYEADVHSWIEQQTAASTKSGAA